MQWIKASELKTLPSQTKYARWGEETDSEAIKSVGKFQQSDGTFFWMEQGYVPVLKSKHNELYILDESPRPSASVHKIDVTDNYYAAECESCGWLGSSGNTDGGGQIADTGDHSDILCPICGSKEIVDAEEEYDVKRLLINIDKAHKAAKYFKENYERVADEAYALSLKQQEPKSASVEQAATPITELLEEWWDEFSEHIDDDSMSFQIVAGSNCMTSRGYKKLCDRIAGHAYATSLLSGRSAEEVLKVPQALYVSLEKEIHDWYKKWCKETGRSGGILITSSIREMLQAYALFKVSQSTKGYSQDRSRMVLEAVRSVYPVSQWTPEVSHLIGEVEKFVYNLPAMQEYATEQRGYTEEQIIGFAEWTHQQEYIPDIIDDTKKWSWACCLPGKEIDSVDLLDIYLQQLKG